MVLVIHSPTTCCVQTGQRLGIVNTYCIKQHIENTTPYQNPIKVSMNVVCDIKLFENIKTS